MENMGSFETNVPKHFTTLLKSKELSKAEQLPFEKMESSEHCSEKRSELKTEGIR